MSTRRPNLCHLRDVVTAMEPWQAGQILLMSKRALWQTVCAQEGCSIQRSNNSMGHPSVSIIIAHFGEIA